MNIAKLLNAIRCHVAVTGLAMGAGLFWATIAAGLARIAFHLEEMHAALFVGLPIAVMFTVWARKFLPQLLGFDESDFKIR